MKLLVDNPLSHRVAEALRVDGHDAVHVREIGLATATDLSLFQLATNEDRHIVTGDTDFSALAVQSGQALPSIILLRLDPSTVSNDIEAIRQVISNWETELEAG